MNACDICERTFKSPSALKIHKNRKTPCSKDEAEIIKTKMANKTTNNVKISNDLSLVNNKTTTNGTVNTFVRNCTVNNTYNNNINANIIMTSVEFEYHDTPIIEEPKSEDKKEETKEDEQPNPKPIPTPKDDQDEDLEYEPDLDMNPDLDPFPNKKYEVKYSNSIMNSCSEEDIEFIKDMINQPDMEELVVFISNFIIDHCTFSNIRNPEFWTPDESLLVRTVKVLVASSTTWNTYEFSNKLNCIAVKTFIEFLTQFMYSYVVGYIYKSLDSSLNPQLNIIFKLMNDKTNLADSIYEKIKDKVSPDNKIRIHVTYGKY
jgi:hypothetical protein